jgi:hypothetical protein
VEDINAELYKLLIYGKGDKFQAHKDTLRSKNHFGSLIVTLPSWYKGRLTIFGFQVEILKGGDFALRHREEEHRFNFSLENKSEMEQMLR